MATEVLNQAWLRLNEGRSYPLAPWATEMDLTGSFRLPEDFIIEMQLPVSAGLTIDPTRFFILSVASYPSGYAISVGYAGDAGSVVAATATIAASALADREFVPVALAGVNDFSDAVGRLVIGRTDGILLQPPGQFVFDLAGSQLDVDCIHPQIQGVSALYVANGQETLGPFYGDITLAAGANFAFTQGLGGAIQASAIQGAGLSASCICASDPSPGTPITSINGIPASSANAFSLLGDDCIKVTQSAGGFQLSDLCSKPCCGSAELAAIAAELARFADEAASLRSFITRLQATEAALVQNVIASKVADSGCVTCT